MEKLKDLVNQREEMYEKIEELKYNMMKVDREIKTILIENNYSNTLIISWRAVHNIIKNS